MRSSVLLAAVLSFTGVLASERVSTNSSSIPSFGEPLPVVEINTARNGLYQSIEWKTPISKLVDSVVNNKGSGNLRERAFGNAQLDPRATKRKETPAEHKKAMAALQAKYRRNKHMKATLALRAKSVKARKAKLAAAKKAKAAKAKKAKAGAARTKPTTKKTTPNKQKKVAGKKPTTKKPVVKTSPKKENSSTSTGKKTSFAVGTLPQIALKAHNDLRAKHDAPEMTWDAGLAAAAQAWTDKCVWKHGGNAGLSAGENLAAHSDTRTTIATGIQMWIAEEKDYDSKNPVASHYTQMIWKASTKIGCAVTRCKDIAGAGFGGNFWACEYKQQGNVFGAGNDRNQYFDKNVS